MSRSEGSGAEADEARTEQAVAWFLRVRSETARIDDIREQRRWFEDDPRNVQAYLEVSAAWDLVGAHSSAPQIVVARRDALEHARRFGQGRYAAAPLGGSWLRRLAIAASVAAALFAAAYWLSAPGWSVYATDVAEQRTLRLPDGSIITLDAASLARVIYTPRERLVELEKGQAKFTVAKDVLRPFRVRARGETVVALGTQFDIDLVSHTVLVTLLEGHVAVTGVRGPDVPAPSSGKSSSDSEAAAWNAGSPASSRPVELIEGQALRVDDGGRVNLLTHVNVAGTIAWQSGQMVFDNEPLGSAVERLNRYTRLQVEVDPAIAGLGISGVFNAGDTSAFVEAVAAYFPVDVRRRGEKRIYLAQRHRLSPSADSSVHP